MHEMHLIKNLIADLFKHSEEQEAKKICKIYLKMGTFTEINEEILRHHIIEQAKGTIAEGAEVSIEPSQMRELRLVSFDCE